MKTNILLISYGDIEYNGRLREFINVLNSIGNLFVIARATIKAEKYRSEQVNIVTSCSYLTFLNEAISYSKALSKKDIDVVFIDDRKAIIPACIAKHIVGAKIVIQDCRELYTFKDVSHVLGKIGCLIEKPSIMKADVLICANQERSVLMKDMYKLKNAPIVYENIRRLNYSAEFDPAIYDAKYKELFDSSEIRILTTAGCRLERTNDVLVKNMSYLNNGFRLIIVGEDAQNDRDEVERIILSNGIDNITILGRLDQNELKYVTRHCHIGVVNYHQNDLNNRYCASGKLYEFLFEGLPVITTTNPPLQSICNKYMVGIADDSYYVGVKQIADNYDEYRQNVANFISEVSVERSNSQLADELVTELLAIRWRETSE